MTSITMCWLPRSRQRTVMEPPAGEYLTAFVVRLVSTWRSRSGSATIFGKPGGDVHEHGVLGEPEGHGVEDERAEVDLAQVEGELAGLDLGDEQRVVGEEGEVLGLADHGAHELLAALRA